MDLSLVVPIFNPPVIYVNCYIMDAHVIASCASDHKDGEDEEDQLRNRDLIVELSSSNRVIKSVGTCDV